MNSQLPIYLSTWSIHDLLFNGQLDILDFPEFAVKHGFNGVEINDTFLSHLNPDSHLILANRLQSRQLGVTLAITNDFTINEPELWLEQIDYVKKLLVTARQLSARLVRLYVGGKNRFIRKLWRQQLGQKDNSPQPKNKTTFQQRIFQFLMQAHTRKLRHLLTNYIFTQNQLDQATFNRLLDSFGEILPVAQENDIRIAIENHWGYSSDPSILLKILKAINSNLVGFCPDFGNFLSNHDRYQALQMLMPLAFNVHAKTYEFDAQGEEKSIDFQRCFQIIRSSSYQGPIVAEFEGIGDSISASAQTKALIEKHLQLSNTEK